MPEVSDVAGVRGHGGAVSTSTAWCGTTSCARRRTSADLQVNLVPRASARGRATRSRVAVRPGSTRSRAVRRRGQGRGDPAGAAGAVDLVAEVYGPDDSTQARDGGAGEAVFEATPGVVDVDWTVEAPQQRRVLRSGRGRPPRRRARASSRSRRRCPSGAVGRAGGIVAIDADRARSERDRAAAASQRAFVDRSAAGAADRDGAGPQPLARFVTVLDSTRERPVSERICGPAIYVTGDVGGRDRVAGVRHARDEGEAGHDARVERRTNRAATTPCSRIGSMRRRSSGTASGR